VIQMGLWDILEQAMYSPYVAMGLLGIVVVMLYFVFSQSGASVSAGFRILYFSETDRVLEEIKPDKITPKQIKCKDNRRFIRNSIAYQWKKGNRTLITWLAKRGRARTFKPANTEEGKAIIIGGLWDALTSVLGDEIEQDFTPEWREALKESKIYVTVELEKGETGDTLSEQDIRSEANNNMAELMASRVRDSMAQNDMVKMIGVMAIGAVLVFLAQQLGVL